ncbi:MAG TPA: plastocyanin/azurin family copper-binding protein [Gemmatimonadaceae bacterium]|nr:plastocyanin/azurin family copper-binding protein [Gemmatimonadaceae bacterium]
MKRMLYTGAALCAAIALLGCGSGEQSPPAETGQATESAAPPAPAGALTPDPGGVVESVPMHTDGDGNYFKPKDFEVHQGDVIRFVIASGVHNVSFPADSNKGKSGLPPVGEVLQLPGQSYDVKVNFAPGSYFYQCDAHAALGMTGRIKVERR